MDFIRENYIDIILFIIYPTEKYTTAKCIDEGYGIDFYLGKFCQ